MAESELLGFRKRPGSRTTRKLFNPKRRRVIESESSSSDTEGATVLDDEDEEGAHPTGTNSQHRALMDLQEEWKTLHRTRGVDLNKIPPPTEFELTDFSIYRLVDPRTENETTQWKREPQMCGLHFLKTKIGYGQLFFDGLLTCGNVARRVQSVPIEWISVEGYGVDSDSVTGLWVQTKMSHKRNMWYRLGNASDEYASFQKNFIWAANFGKYVVDYLEEHENVKLADFRMDFLQWTTKHHGNTAPFKAWVSEICFTDFAKAVNFYSEYLRVQAANSNTAGWENHPLWKELDLTIIPRQPTALPEGSKTVLTPNVYQHYKKAYFGEYLEPREMSVDVKARWAQRKRHLGFADDSKWALMSHHPAPTRGKRPKSVKPGHVVGIRALAEGHSKKSRLRESYLYVRHLEHDDQGVYYRGLHLYRPEETTIKNAPYRFNNELFLSDNCNCRETKVRHEDITCKIEVIWQPTEIPTSKYFCRLTFHTVAESLPTKEINKNGFYCIKESDHDCHCSEPPRSEFDCAVELYRIHDTVLVRVSNDNSSLLEPFVIKKFLTSRQMVLVRRLLRVDKHPDGHLARPNHLIWTSLSVEIEPQNIIRRCHIIFHLQGQSMPRVYDRDGQGDCFVVTKHLVTDSQRIKGLQHEFLTKMNLGDNFGKFLQGLSCTGLSTFSGGGNFDRGLEDSGAVHITTMIENDENAAHTYRANLPDPERTKPFLGCINEYIARAIDGEESQCVPGIGHVDIHCGGPCCTGCSKLQNDPLCQKACKDTSLTASWASVNDLYRPYYAIMENVPALSRELGPRNDNILAFTISCHVSMGYQVSQFVINSGSTGDPQSRERVFITLAAPVVQPMSQPPFTHKLPTDTPQVSLGKLSSGESILETRVNEAPFHYVSAAQATSDLPPLKDGQLHTCIPYPDHVVTSCLSSENRELITAIPKIPPEQGLHSLVGDTSLSLPLQDRINRENERLLKVKNNKPGRSWKRLNGQKLFRTVTTSVRPGDFKGGQVLHWHDDRTVTVEEIARAQGYPANYVTLGTPYTQCKTIGNAVSRSVALSLGISLARAMIQSPALFSKVVANSNRSEQKYQGVVKETAKSEEGRTNNNITLPIRLSETPSRQTDKSRNRLFLELDDDGNIVDSGSHHAFVGESPALKLLRASEVGTESKKPENDDDVIIVHCTFSEKV